MYPVAVRLARAAPNYKEGEIDGTLFHIAGFQKSPAELRCVAHLLDCQGAKDLRIYVDTHAIDAWEFASVIRCYLRSCRCTDWRAYCQKVTTQLFSDERSEDRSMSLRITLTHIHSEENKLPARRYLFPCAYLVERAPVRLERSHPASVEAQVQAIAVKLGCDLCPRFDADAFRELTTVAASGTK
jgi:hypothetical protein